jgi:hypothetical protein
MPSEDQLLKAIASAMDTGLDAASRLSSDSDTWNHLAKLKDAGLIDASYSRDGTGNVRQILVRGLTDYGAQLIGRRVDPSTGKLRPL